MSFSSLTGESFSKENKKDPIEPVGNVCPTVDVETDSDSDAEGENVLSAFGDISLSTIDFVPGPPSALSPSRNSGRNNKRSDTNPLSTIRRKLLRPGPPKGTLRKVEPTFEMMVQDLQKSRGKSKSSAILSVAHPPCASPLRELKNFGPEAVIPRIDAVIANAGSHEAVQNNAAPQTAMTAKPCAAVPDENGTSPVGAVNIPKKNGLRGNAKLPKRLPIPRWDFDNDSINHEAHGG